LTISVALLQVEEGRQKQSQAVVRREDVHGGLSLQVRARARQQGNSRRKGEAARRTTTVVTSCSTVEATADDVSSPSSSVTGM